METSSRQSESAFLPCSVGNELAKPVPGGSDERCGHVTSLRTGLSVPSDAKAILVVRRLPRSQVAGEVRNWATMVHAA